MISVSSHEVGIATKGSEGDKEMFFAARHGEAGKRREGTGQGAGEGAGEGAAEGANVRAGVALASVTSGASAEAVLHVSEREAASAGLHGATDDVGP